MAELPDKSLTDLSERTATANTDLLHVNSGGTDYKQTKANLLKSTTHIATAASGVTIARFQCYEAGDMIHVSGVVNITSAKSTQDLILTLNGVSVPSTTDIVGATNTAPAIMIMIGSQIKANMSIPTGYLFFNFSARISQ